MGRVYAFDLVGAGIGALGVVPLLWLVDAPTLIVALGARRRPWPRSCSRGPAR